MNTPITTDQQPAVTGVFYEGSKIQWLYLLCKLSQRSKLALG